MCKFNVYDVSEIQECLDAYLNLIKWMPTLSIDEMAMRDARVEHVEYLIDKCEKIILGEKIWESGKEDE